MRFDEVLFLEIEDVELVHARMIAEYGGADGLRDAGLLESAVMAPRSGYYSTLAELAAAYAIGIALNHAFIDGNKRAALASAGMFSSTLTVSTWCSGWSGSRGSNSSPPAT
jgi:death-on-curing protein